MPENTIITKIGAYDNPGVEKSLSSNVAISAENIKATGVHGLIDASGTHTVRVMKEMFKMKEQSFTVNDGQTTNANITMVANFVTLTVNTDADAEIYVDEEYKGKGRWTGKVSEGLHNLEARKQNHRSSKTSVDLVLGENKTITLEAPKPINGSIEINSSPMEANIYIDGKSYGTTPNYINEILIGTHELKLEKQGCTTITKSITIKEGETLSVNEKLQTGKEIVIKTDKSGDKIYVDNNYVGLSPVTTSLAFGSHTIKAERDGKYVNKTINVSQYGGDNNQSFSNDVVYIINSFGYAFAQVTGFIAIAQFNCFVYAGRSTGRNSSTTNSAVFQNNFNFYGRIAARV